MKDLGPVEEFHILLHESIHRVSYSKSFAVETENGKRYGRKTGYRTDTNDAKRGEFSNDSFFALNEVMVEKAAFSLMEKNKQKLQDLFGLDKSGFEEAFARSKDSAYMKRYGGIIASVIEKVAAAENESLQEEDKIALSDMEQKFILAQFTGQTFHMRKIDRVFGPGSTRVLAALGCPMDSAEEKKEKTALITQYFASSDIEEKKKLQQMILSAE